MTLYQALLMDHYHHPRNYGKLENPHFQSGDMNPSCGDSVSLQGIVENNHLKKVCFTAQGCVISIAAASLLTEHVTGLSLDQIEQLTPETMQQLLGITLGPLRLKCALLPLQALQKGIVEFKKAHHA